jgi:ubiquinone/menaquinone biosynthesis C-methylase UbiE
VVSTYSKSINRHYGPADISARILESLRKAGKDMSALDRDDFTPFDEFHGGGRESTRDLAVFAGLESGMKLLDVGSGVGGPARTLTVEFGCRVTGIDLTEEFCRAAEMLTDLAGFQGQIDFRQGSALDLPFDDASFDVVWCQNVLMNVEDKGRAFEEVYRVLRPGGLFAFETVLAGSTTETLFPVFWAESPALSFLVGADEIRRVLGAIGFEERDWLDTTARSIKLTRKRLAVIERDGMPDIGLGVIVPIDVVTKFENSLRNNEEGRTETMQAVFVKGD